MPPKSKAKSIKKDERQDLTQYDKRPSAVDKPMAKKRKSSIRKHNPIKKFNSQDEILNLGSVTDNLTTVRSTVKSDDMRKTLNKADSTQKASAYTYFGAEDTLEKMFEYISSSEIEIDSDPEAYYNQNSPNESMADADTLLTSNIVISKQEDKEDAHFIRDAISDQNVKQDDMEEETDFFGYIADVPDVEELSMDVSAKRLQSMEKSKPKSTRPRRRDTGQFVDPITGEIIYTTVPDEEEEEIVVVVKKQKQQVVDEPVMFEGRVVKEIKLLPPPSDDEISLDILSDQEDKSLGMNVVEEEDILNQFLELDAAVPVVTFETVAVDTFSREENARIVRMLTDGIIDYLINIVVEKTEYVDPIALLRQNLDKRKLMKELSEQLMNLEVERKVKQFLNSKCVKYYQRKHNYRLILPDNPKTMQIQYHKYEEAVTGLDHWLLRLQEAEATSKKNMEAAREQYKIASARSEEKVDELENLMRKTLKLENFDKLNQLVTERLNQMTILRKEISDARIEMIQMLHDKAHLTEQLQNLEDLGNGLSMHDFEIIQTATHVLSKKIGERDIEFSKIIRRGQIDIHRMAHMKEKQQMLLDNLEKQRFYMDQLQIEKDNLREFLTRLKCDRIRLRKDIRELSYQSGLFDQPLLMRDYDATVEHLTDVKTRVDSLQLTMSTLNAKIKILEQKCNKK